MDTVSIRRAGRAVALAVVVSLGGCGGCGDGGGGEEAARCDGVVCTASDACHDVGTCDPGTGLCSDPAKVDWTPCGTASACLAGACTAGTRLDAIDPTGWASTEGGFNTNHAELRCGDDGRGGGSGYELYPGLTFDLGPLPEGFTLDRAALYAHQVRVDGHAPYGAALHEVVVEHVEYANMWLADEVAAIQGTIGQRVLSQAAGVGWRFAEVTEAVDHALAGSGTQVQLRLRFNPSMADGDTEADWAIFASEDAPETVQRPYLLALEP